MQAKKTVKTGTWKRLLQASVRSQQQGSSLLLSLMIVILIASASLSMFADTAINQKSTANYIAKNETYHMAENNLRLLLARDVDSLVDYQNPNNSIIPTIPKQQKVHQNWARLNSNANTPQPDSTLTITLNDIVLKDDVKFSEAEPGNPPAGLLLYRLDTRAQLGNARSHHRMAAKVALPPQPDDPSSTPFDF